MVIDFGSLVTTAQSILVVGAHILLVAAGLTSIYVLMKAAEIVLLLLRGGTNSLRAHYEIRDFERRYKIDSRYRERKQRRLEKEARYKQFKAERDDPWGVFGSLTKEEKKALNNVSVSGENPFITWDEVRGKM
jgi:hypothetical protein